MQEYLWPEMADRWHTGQRPSEEPTLNFVRKLLPENIACGKCCDIWIERYLVFVLREIDACDRDSIGSHYHRCALSAYLQFKATGKSSDRFCAWLLIQAAFRWLARVDGGIR